MEVICNWHFLFVQFKKKILIFFIFLSLHNAFLLCYFRWICLFCLMGFFILSFMRIWYLPFSSSFHPFLLFFLKLSSSSSFSFTFLPQPPLPSLLSFLFSIYHFFLLFPPHCLLCLFRFLNLLYYVEISFLWLGQNADREWKLSQTLHLFYPPLYPLHGVLQDANVGPGWRGGSVRETII